MTRYSVNQLVNERRGVTPATALRLSEATGTATEFLPNLQSALDLHEVRWGLRERSPNVRAVVPPVPEEEMFEGLDGGQSKTRIGGRMHPSAPGTVCSMAAPSGAGQANQSGAGA